MTNLQLSAADCQRSTREISTGQRHSRSSSQPLSPQGTIEQGQKSCIQEESSKRFIDRDSSTGEVQTSTVDLKATNAVKNLQWKVANTNQVLTPSPSPRPPIPQNSSASSSRPTSSRLSSHSKNFAHSSPDFSSRPSSNRTQLLPSTPQPNHNHHLRCNSNIYFSDEKIFGNRRPSGRRRPISCDVLVYSRSGSSQGKYHEHCFPKEDPSLIIGSPIRLESARLRRASRNRRRPASLYSEPLLNNREAVINIIYTDHLDAEQDEIGRARAATLREARALRGGGFASNSFSKEFFRQGNGWTAQTTKRLGGVGGAWGSLRRQLVCNIISSNISNNNKNSGFLMKAGKASGSFTYPTLQEEDTSMCRFNCSRHCPSPGSDHSSTSQESQTPALTSSSDHGQLSPSLQTNSPGLDSDQTQRGPGFLYQVVGFDRLADNVPTFVRQNVKKNGRLLTESFILRLNYLRRRRALGETSSTMNSSKSKTAVMVLPGQAGGTSAAPAASGDFPAPS